VERQGGTGPALVPQRLAGTDEEVLRGIINEGRPGTAMPPWQGILTDQQMDDLVGYILSPVEESVLTWGIDDMCGNCVKVTPTNQLPAAPTWGGKVEDFMAITFLFIHIQQNDLLLPLPEHVLIHLSNVEIHSASHYAFYVSFPVLKR
jgi:hypothetical protein